MCGRVWGTESSFYNKCHGKVSKNGVFKNTVGGVGGMLLLVLETLFDRVWVAMGGWLRKDEEDV